MWMKFRFKLLLLNILMTNMKFWSWNLHPKISVILLWNCINKVGWIMIMIMRDESAQQAFINVNCGYCSKYEHKNMTVFFYRFTTSGATCQDGSRVCSRPPPWLSRREHGGSSEGTLKWHSFITGSIISGMPILTPRQFSAVLLWKSSTSKLKLFIFQVWEAFKKKLDPPIRWQIMKYYFWTHKSSFWV